MREGVVATVNGAPIDSKTLDAAMQNLAREKHQCALVDTLPEARAGLREMALEQLVARELIFQAAMAEGLVADEAEVRAECGRILGMTGSPADFRRRLTERGMDEAALLRMVRKDLTVDRMTERKLAEVREPAEAEISAFFAAHPERLRVPERVRVSHILLPRDPQDAEGSLEHARALKARAAREDFAQLARSHSLCASAAGGGDLGFIRREDVDPAFAAAAFDRAAGEVIGPVETPYGCHLIKVTARENALSPILDQVRGQIIGFLKRASGVQLLKAWVDGLRDQARIDIHAG